MIASGTTIDRIVRGWVSRRPSEIGATSVGSISRASTSDSGSWWWPNVGSSGRGGLHRTGPYRTVRPVGHRSMVLPVPIGHVRPAEPGGGPSVDPGRTRPLPRTRLTPLANGVQSRTK